jgi:hypothetical protein
MSCSEFDCFKMPDNCQLSEAFAARTWLDDTGKQAAACRPAAGLQTWRPRFRRQSAIFDRMILQPDHAAPSRAEDNCPE